MSFRWGVFGTGAVAAKFVADVSATPGTTVAMVASRTQAGADAFARAFGIGSAIEGYEVAARPGGVDAVYIATPPSEHLAHARFALAAGLPVLVEKPFARTAVEARELATAAREAGVFCMEGMWTLFLPAAQRLRELVGSGEIGEVRQLNGSLGFANQVDPAAGNFDPGRGGGALAHLAIYPVSLGQWLFGSPTQVRALGRVGETGVEEEVTCSLRYSAGVLASFHASLRSTARNSFEVLGTHGSVEFSGPIYRPSGVVLARSEPRSTPRAGFGRSAQLREHGAVQRLAQVADTWAPHRAQPRFYSGNGYRHEAVEVARCITEGLKESPVMPLDESIGVAETLDRIRAELATDGSQE